MCVNHAPGKRQVLRDICQIRAMNIRSGEDDERRLRPNMRVARLSDSGVIQPFQQPIFLARLTAGCGRLPPDAAGRGRPNADGRPVEYSTATTRQVSAVHLLWHSTSQCFVDRVSNCKGRSASTCGSFHFYRRADATNGGYAATHGQNAASSISYSITVNPPLDNRPILQSGSGRSFGASHSGEAVILSLDKKMNTRHFDV